MNNTARYTLCTFIVICLQGEKFSSVKDRIQKRLDVPDKEFEKVSMHSLCTEIMSSVTVCTGFMLSLMVVESICSRNQPVQSFWLEEILCSLIRLKLAVLLWRLTK